MSNAFEVDSKYARTVLDIVLVSLYLPLNTFRLINLSLLLLHPGLPCLTLFFPVFPFDPSENNQRFSDVSRVAQKGTLGRNGLNMVPSSGFVFIRKVKK